MVIHGGDGANPPSEFELSRDLIAVAFKGLGLWRSIQSHVHASDAARPLSLIRIVGPFLLWRDCHPYSGNLRARPSELW
jgi:hypothetical protein